MKISIKVGNKELRTIESIKGQHYIDVVQWDMEEESCFTLMYWSNVYEEITMMVVEDRVLEHMTPEEFFFFHKIGNKIIEGLQEWRWNQE